MTKEYRKRGYEVPYSTEEPEENSQEKASESDERGEEVVERDSGNKNTGPSFELFDLEMRLQILFDLCNFHHENPTYFVEHLLKGYDEGPSWRLEPLGKDSHQMAYWLFEDGRLYREKVDKANLPVDAESWELVCYNRKTWDEFLADGLTNKPGDRRLKEALEAEKKTISDALEIEDAYEAQKAKALAQAAHKALYDSLPRKRSSRLQEKDVQRQKMLAEMEAQEEEERRYMAELHLARTGVLPPVKKPTGTEAITHGLSREERAELRRQKIEQEANAKLLRELEEQQAEVDRERLKNEALAEVDVVGDVQHSPKIKLVIRQSNQHSPLNKPAANANSAQSQSQRPNVSQKKPSPSPELLQYLYNMQQQQQRQLQMQQQQQLQMQQQQQQQLQMQHQAQLQQQQAQQQQRQPQMQEEQQRHLQLQQQRQLQMQHQAQFQQQQQQQQMGHQQYHHPNMNQMQHQQQYAAQQLQHRNLMNQPMVYPQSHALPPQHQYQQVFSNPSALPALNHQSSHHTQQPNAPLHPSAPTSLDSLLNAVDSQDTSDAANLVVSSTPQNL